MLTSQSYTTIIIIPMLSRLSLAFNKEMKKLINVIHTSCRSESSNYKLGRLDKLLNAGFVTSLFLNCEKL